MTDTERISKVQAYPLEIFFFRNSGGAPYLILYINMKEKNVLRCNS